MVCSDGQQWLVARAASSDDSTSLTAAEQNNCYLPGIKIDLMEMFLIEQGGESCRPPARSANVNYGDILALLLGPGLK